MAAGLRTPQNVPRAGLRPAVLGHRAIAGATGLRYLVFTGLSSSPRWRADGAQLFFATGIQDLMAVDVNTHQGSRWERRGDCSPPRHR